MSVPLADINFGELLPLVFEVFLLVVWVWICVTLVTDLIRDRELSGWWKAVWVLFLLFVPYLTGLVYLIARGHGMRQRAIRAHAEARAFDHAVAETNRALLTDEMDLLEGLHAPGGLTNVEFEAAKARHFA